MKDPADISAASLAPPSGGDIGWFMVPSDGHRLRYGVWQPAPGTAPRGTVLFLNGRAEFMEKQFETVADLQALGFGVLTFDWRGQGLSGRFGDHPHKDHIVDFDRRLADLQEITAAHLFGHLPGPYYLLAHSMGGHFALRWMAMDAPAIDKAVLAAPLIALNASFALRRLVQGLAGIMTRVGAGRRWAPGQTSYGAFHKSETRQKMLTSDKARFAMEHAHIAANPDLTIGGVTYAWLKASADSIDALGAPGVAESIQVPTLVVRAGREHLVDNHDMAEFVARMPNARLHTIADAHHEILRECDAIRDGFWRDFDDFIGR